MELIAILFLIGLGYGVKGLADNVRGDLRQSREAKVKAAAKAAGGKLPKHQRAAVARRHTRGWWAREVTGGFPAARTGWHAGWIAHKTALARQQIIREEARTEHAETQTSFRKDLAEHRKRQAAARAELERELAAQQAKGSPATGRSAVQKAADEVTARREKRKQTGGKCPGCGAPDGYPCLPGCDPSTAARKAATPPPAPTPAKATPAHDQSRGPALAARGTARCPRCGDLLAGASLEASLWCDRCDDLIHKSEWVMPDSAGQDSAHLRPGEPRCEGCEGSGRNDAANDACPACRGFGSAPADPDSPVAADNAICGACGHGQRPDDPVLAAAGGYNTHRSHATEQTGEYQDALDRMRRAENEPGPDAARNPQPVTTPASPTTTEGAPVTDTNYTAVLANAKTAADQAEQDAVAAAQRRATAENHADAMQAANVKGNCLGAQMELVDQLRLQEQIAKAAGEQAQAVSDHLQREHGGIKGAVDDAPVNPADMAFYQGD